MNLTYFQMTVCLKYFAVEVCSSLPSYSHMSLNTLLRIYGTLLKATCHHGYEISVGVTSQYSTCLGTGGWDSVIADCQGKIYHED